MQTFQSDGVALAYRDLTAEGADRDEPIRTTVASASSSAA